MQTIEKHVQKGRGLPYNMKHLPEGWRTAELLY